MSTRYQEIDWVRSLEKKLSYEEHNMKRAVKNKRKQDVADLLELVDEVNSRETFRRGLKQYNWRP